MCALRGAAADRGSVSLVTAGRRYSGKEAGSAGKGRQVWGEAPPAPYTCLSCPGGSTEGLQRRAGETQPAPRGDERSSDLRRCELPSLPRG